MYFTAFGQRRHARALVNADQPCADRQALAGLAFQCRFPAVGQAAQVTAIDRDRLRAIEAGDATPTDAELARLRETYDVAGFVGATR